MGLFRRRQEDRAKRYTIQLKRATYAKLGLISERFGTSEGDTLDAIIDFSLASYGVPSQASNSPVDLASLITGSGEGEGSDPVMELVKGLLPQLLKGSTGSPNTSSTAINSQNGSVSENPDVGKALRDLGL